MGQLQLPAATWLALSDAERDAFRSATTCALAAPAWADAAGTPVDDPAKATWAVWDGATLPDGDYPKPFRRMSDETDRAEVRSGRAPDRARDRPVTDAVAELSGRRPRIDPVPVLELDDLAKRGGKGKG